MDSIISHAAALETAARDYFLVCGHGVFWCLLGIEAVIALLLLALAAVVARFVWRHWQAVLFVTVILLGAVLAGILGFG